MSLSHWDFRPKKRSKYVAVGNPAGRPGPQRTRLVVRTLLLSAFGLLVYLKYDDFIKSDIFRSLRDPASLATSAWARLKARFVAAADPASAPLVSADSTWMEWKCAAAAVDSCLAAFTGLDAAEKARARAILAKSRFHLGLDSLQAFNLAYRRLPPAAVAADSADPSGAEEASLPIFAQALVRTPEGWFTVARRAADAALCATREGGETACLEPPSPKPPLRRFGIPTLGPERPPVLAFPGSEAEAIHPVLPGRVVALPADSSGWVKVHHGDNLYSYYAGQAGLHPSIRPGAAVDPEDTLGFTIAPDSLLAGAMAFALRLRIEKDGAPVDPLAFLGLATDSAGTGHAP